MNVKDRLTAHNEAGQGIINMDGVSDALEASARIRSFSPLIISRLTEYEDTGLYPDEVNALKAETAALRERLEKTEKENAVLGEKLARALNAFGVNVYNENANKVICVGLKGGKGCR